MRSPLFQKPLYGTLTVFEVTGIPFWLGKISNPNVALGPEVLRDHGIFRNFFDRGDLSLYGPIHEQLRTISDHVAGLGEKRGIFVGGDHGLSLGTIDGVLRKRPDTLVIWLDAHADLNTPSTSVTGNFHGVPLSYLLPFRDPSPDFDWVISKLHPSDLLLLGPRDIDPPEKAFIREYEITVAPVDVSALIRWISERDPTGCRPIHLSFDVDVLDPKEFPSTGTPVKKGERPEAILRILEALMKTGRLESVDLVEFSPKGGAFDERSLGFLGKVFQIFGNDDRAV